MVLSAYVSQVLCTYQHKAQFRGRVEICLQKALCTETLLKTKDRVVYVVEYATYDSGPLLPSGFVLQIAHVAKGTHPTYITSTNVGTIF